MITQIRMNQGRALLHMAGFYPTLLSTTLELVQNSLDKDVLANRIEIMMNYRLRTLFVRDNGKGTTVERFNMALASVAEPKRKGEGSLGQFGIGLISPLGKCKRFTFTSCPDPETDSYREWTFDTNKIVAQKDNISVPLRVRNDLTLSDDPAKNRNKFKVDWRSEMLLSDITTDKLTTAMTIDQLIGSIIDRYGTTMYRNKVSINVTFVDEKGMTETRSNVMAPGYKGTPLPEFVARNKEAGKTVFNLFVAQQTSKGRQGKIQMGQQGSDFRIPFRFFARSATDLLGEKVTSALSSGLFEGEIISQRARLHPSRQTFEKDDSFVGLCLAIEDWYEKVGASYHDEVKQEQESHRFQDLGLRSISVIEHLVKDPRHRALLSVIEGFGRGTIGQGHTEIPGRGVQDRPSLSVQGRNKSKEAEGGGNSDSKTPETEKERHHPFTVAGSKGTRRHLVRNSSFGLQLLHEAMQGSPDLWKLDCHQGILIFNVRHPLWTVCDEKGDSTVMKLQEYVAIQALTLYAMPENLRSAQRQVLDEVLGSFVGWLLEGDRLRASASKK